MTFTPFSLPTEPNSQILLGSDLATQVQGTTSTPLAEVDLQNRPGWYYNSIAQNNNFEWTIFDGTYQNYKLGDVQNLTFTATHDNLPDNKCYMAISSTAGSKIIYESSGVDLIPGEKCLFYTNTIPSNPDQLRLVQLNLVTEYGPCSNSEKLLTITLEGTNAVFSDNYLQVCVENIGYLFGGETVPVVVNLSTINGDVAALNATLQITNDDLTTLNGTLGTTNTTLGTNTTALDTNTNASDTNTTALGTNTTALGVTNTTLGTNTTALGTNTTALGTLNNTLQSGVITTSLPALNYDAFGRFRVSNPFTLFDSNFRYGDNGLWATSTPTPFGGIASPVVYQGLMNLTVTATTNSQVIRETYRVFSYQPGKSLLVFNSFVGTTVAGVQQRIGYYGAQNGFYFQINGDGTCSFVKRSYVTNAVVNTSVNQSAWNGDKLNGTGPSGYTLYLTKPQLLWMDFEWLGVGTVRCGFVINEQFILCHSFNWANDPGSSNSTYMTTASLPCRCEIINTGGDGGTLKQICSTVISEGGYELSGTQLSVATPLSSPKATTTTAIPIISLRLNTNKLDAVVIMTAMNIVPNGSSNNTYYWQIVRGGTTGGGTWVTALSGSSSVDYNLFPSAGTIAGGICMASGFFTSSNQAKGGVELLKEALFRFQLLRNGLTSAAIELTVVCSSVGSSSVFASVDWEEITR